MILKGSQNPKTSMLPGLTFSDARKDKIQSTVEQAHRGVSSVQSLSCVRLSVTPRTAARQVSLSITNSLSLLKLMSIESVMPSNHLILCHSPSPPRTRDSTGFNSIVLLYDLGKNHRLSHARWASACPTYELRRGKDSVPTSTSGSLCVW